MTTAPIPRGFEVISPEPGHCVIRYRTTGMWADGCFFTIWLTIWSAGCLLATYHVVVDGGMAFFLPFLMWPVEIFTLAYVCWYFLSVTVLVFAPEQLTVERSLLGWRRRRVFRREDVRAVVQVKDGGNGEDSFPSWGLVVTTAATIKVISRQPFEKSAWLGSIVAEWAGVPFEPTISPEREKVEEL